MLENLPFVLFLATLHSPPPEYSLVTPAKSSARRRYENEKGYGSKRLLRPRRRNAYCAGKWNGASGCSLSLSLSLLAREKRCASVERQRERKRREKMRGAERSGLNRGWIRGNGVLACRKFRARARCYGVRVPRVWHEVCQIAYKRADPLLRPRAYRIGHSRVYTANTIGRHRSPLCCAEKRRDRERERERVRNDRPRLSRARHLILGKGETRLRASARPTPIYLRRHVWVNGFCR